MIPSKEVENAMGEARARTAKDKSAAELLTEKREALSAAREKYATAKTMRDEELMSEQMRLIDALNELIPALETEVVGVREATAKAAAVARLVGVRRAFGSVTSSIDADEKRVVEKIAELSDAITRLNDRYTQVVQLRAEAMALSDRFELPKPSLPDVVPPARRDIVVTLTRLPNKLRDRVDRYQPTEECEHRMRTRRTYAEAAGTPGAQIIEAAGLVAFPELTERQKEIIAAREREKEQELRAFASLPKMPAEGSIPLGTL